MNFKTQFLIISLSINISFYLFSAAEKKIEIVPGLSCVTHTLGTPYPLANLPSQDNPLTPKQIEEKSFRNLWGLWSTTASTKTPREHVLTIIKSGQLNAACALAPIKDGDTTVQTTDPVILNLLALITGEEFTKLRADSHFDRLATLKLLQDHRKKRVETFDNIALLLAAIQSSTATQGVITPERKHLWTQALEETNDYYNTLFEEINEEHKTCQDTLQVLKNLLSQK